MKKKLHLLLICLLTSLVFMACSKDESQGEITIGINQFMEHPALDDARLGFIDRLKKSGVNFKIDYINAQGDLTTALTISEKFASDKVDLIFAIGTPSAQASKQASSSIPILFSAVTDPVASGLLKNPNSPEANITGSSDKADIKSQIKLFKALDPSIKTIGIIYNTGESNSLAQLEDVSYLAASENLGLELVGITSMNEISQALESITRKVDAMYFLSDNMVASAIGQVREVLLEKKMISISAEESQVAGGLLLTQGISYYDLGSETGDMALKILLDQEDISKLGVGHSKNMDLKYNSQSLKALGLSEKNSIFQKGKAIK